MYRYLLLFLVVLAPSAWAGTCRVMADGVATQDGSSWAMATTLHAALNAPAACSEIWVAEGVYVPGPNGYADSFGVMPGTALYGGFAGNETSRDARDPRTRFSILSGDTLGNDVNADGNHIDETWNDIVQTGGFNSYHIVIIDAATYGSVGADTVLDGFVITGSYGNSLSSAFLCKGTTGVPCSPTLRNLRVVGNFNFAGAMRFEGLSSSVLTNVQFSGNHGTSDADAFKSEGSGNFTLVNVTFNDNTGAQYGAMVLWPAAAGDVLTMQNVTFSGNTIAGAGGILNLGYLGSNAPMTAILRNVTFSGNAADYNGSTTRAIVCGNCTLSLSNVILWDSPSVNPEILTGGQTSVSIGHSIVRGSGGSGAWNLSGFSDYGGNIDINPGLQALSRNGGYVLTQMPDPLGVAVDAGEDSSCTPIDARDIPRPQGLHCDIGAVETAVYATALDAVGGQGQHTPTYSAFPLPLAVHVTYNGNAVIGARVAAAAPNTGASAACTDGISDNVGIALIYCTANNTVGSYSVQLSVATEHAGVLSAAFPLSNDVGDMIFVDSFEAPVP